MPDPLACIVVPRLERLELPLPGGAMIAGEFRKLLDMAQPALAPLAPFFTVIETMMAIIAVVEAVPAALGPPPDPAKLSSTLADLKDKVERLVLLLPQAALPATLVAIVDILIAELGAVRRELLTLQLQAERVRRTRMTADSLVDAALSAIADCAEQTVNQEASNLARALASLEALLTLVGMFSQLVGGPAPPSFRALEGKPLDALIEPIDALIDQLTTLRAAIPGAP